MLKLAAMLPGVTDSGMDALRAGRMVTFESVATEVGHNVKGEVPGYVVSKDAATKMFEKDGLLVLLNSGHLRTMHGCPFLAVFPPQSTLQQSLIMPWTGFNVPALEKMPWQCRELPQL